MKKQIQLGLLVVLTCIVFATPALALDVEEHWHDTIQRAFDRSVQDAANAEPSEIAPLMPIVPENPQLIWQTIDGEKYIKVVTWTGWNGYDSKVGQEMLITRDIWVTPAPEVQQFAQQLAPASEAVAALRLEQLLGLPPDAGKDRWVELWIKPADLFRPCPDAEITDTACGLLFPDEVTDEHRAWIVNLTLSSYGDRGYPWTRLGYTYDWGGMDTEVGANELVIRQDSTAIVESVQSNTEYLQLAE